MNHIKDKSGQEGLSESDRIEQMNRERLSAALKPSTKKEVLEAEAGIGEILEEFHKQERQKFRSSRDLAIAILIIAGVIATSIALELAPITFYMVFSGALFLWGVYALYIRRQDKE